MRWLTRGSCRSCWGRKGDCAETVGARPATWAAFRASQRDDVLAAGAQPDGSTKPCEPAGVFLVTVQQQVHRTADLQVVGEEGQRGLGPRRRPALRSVRARAVGGGNEAGVPVRPQGCRSGEAGGIKKFGRIRQADTAIAGAGPFFDESGLGRTPGNRKGIGSVQPSHTALGLPLATDGERELVRGFAERDSGGALAVVRAVAQPGNGQGGDADHHTGKYGADVEGMSQPLNALAVGDGPETHPCDPQQTDHGDRARQNAFPTCPGRDPALPRPHLRQDAARSHATAGCVAHEATAHLAYAGRRDSGRLLTRSTSPRAGRKRPVRRGSCTACLLRPAHIAKRSAGASTLTLKGVAVPHLREVDLWLPCT